MDLKEIQTLIKFVASQGVDEVNIERKDFKLSIKKADRSAPMSAQIVHALAPPTAQASFPQTAAPTAPAVDIKAAETVVASNLIEIKSPMIGTFYRSATPDSDVFVNVGDEVSEGKVVCIIEAMKLFNEIESEISGKIVKMLVENATPVEYDQPLFLVEPN